MQGLTLQQLADLYDASTSEIRKLVYYYFWEWWNEKPVAGAGHSPYASTWKRKNGRLAYKKRKTRMNYKIC